MHSNVVCPALPLQIERRKKRGAAKEGVDPTTLGHPFRSLNARGNRYRPCRELRRPLSKRGPLFQSCTAVCVSCFLPLLPRRVSYIPPSDWIFLPEKGRYFIVIEVRGVFFFLTYGSNFVESRLFPKTRLFRITVHLSRRIEPSRLKTRRQIATLPTLANQASTESHNPPKFQKLN